MEKLNKIFTILVLTVLINTGILAQSIPTLELTRSATPTNNGFGTSILPMTATLQNDALNDNNFAANPTVVTVTATLQNQTFTGLNYGTGTTAQTTGLVFGLGPTVGSSSTLGGSARNRWDILGAYTGSFGPTDNMYTSNPKATGAQLGTGMIVGNDVFSRLNGGFDIFTTAYELYKQNIPITQRVLFGQLKLTFSQPVINPVIHIAGLGGSFRYSVIGQDITNPASWRSAFFSTELELQNAGVTSTLMSGNQFFSISGNKILNSNNVNPNGASVNDPGPNTPPSFNEYGAASGSVRINGTVQELVYNVYLEAGTGSQFPWAVDKTNILGASTDPFTGDIWYVSASIDNPTQQISGNVFIDPQTTDNNINQSYGAPNSPTNANGRLYANLISGGLVVATVPVAANGAYLFDNVPVGTYTVQLSSTQGTVGIAPPANQLLPQNWVNTGEFIGSGAGTDGTINGVSASITVAVSSIITNVNFGIKTQTCPQVGLNGLVVGGNLNPTIAGNYGSFNLTPGTSNFYPTKTLWDYGTQLGHIWANTPLAPANYGIVGNASSFDPALGTYNALGDFNSMMVVKPTAANQVVYYVTDSIGLNTNGVQARYKCVQTIFRGWYAKASATDATIRIKIYDRDDPTKVFATKDTTLTGAAGNWIYLEIQGQVNTCVNPGDPNQVSATKSIRTDIISLNGAPFSIDELCHVPPPLPLPITMSELTLSKSACNATLTWKTSQESNSDRFEVEVSTGNNPVYTAAGTVAAAGYSTETKTYKFTYPMQEGVVYYFRIKMIDKDGSFRLSDIRSSSCSKGKGDIVIVPNPVKTIFTISGMEDGKNTIMVYGANGQLVKTQTIAQNQGDVNITYLAPGMYMVKITSEKGNTVVSKLIKY